MTKKKRYGDAWKNVDIPERQLDPVFDRFFSQPEPSPSDSEPPSKFAPASDFEPIALQIEPGAESAPLIAKHYTRVVNAVLDDLLPTLKPAAQIVYLHLYRLSFGHQRPTCRVSVPRLAERANASENTVRAGLRELEGRGLVRRLDVAFQGTARGLRFEVLLPASTPADALSPSKSEPGAKSEGASKSAPMKESLKTKHETGDVAPGSVYHIRTIAARFREIHHGDPAYTLDQLRADTRTALDGQGVEYDEAALDEATAKMG